MDINKIPMGKIIEMELAIGMLLPDVFDEGTEKNPKPESPWAKLVYAYLNALSAGNDVSWDDMKKLSPNQIAEFNQADDADPKEVSELNN